MATKRTDLRGAMLAAAQAANEIPRGDLIILAAIFARSNMGCGLPDAALVQRLRKLGTGTRLLSLEGAVVAICRDYIETDQMVTGFVDEAGSWITTLKKDGKAEISRVHSEIAELFWGKEDPLVRRMADLGRAERRKKIERYARRKRPASGSAPWRGRS